MYVVSLYLLGIFYLGLFYVVRTALTFSIWLRTYLVTYHQQQRFANIIFCLLHVAARDTSHVEEEF